MVNYFKLYKKAGLTVHNIQKDKKNPVWVIDDKIITEYKDITLEERKKRMDEMEDLEYGYGIFTGRQHSGKYIIGLDFDIYDSKTNDDNEKALEVFKNIRYSKWEPYFNTSTCGNKSILVEITDDEELIELIESYKSKKIVRLDGGLEILNGFNYVLPPTATICKIHNKICSNREFHFYDGQAEWDVDKDNLSTRHYDEIIYRFDDIRRDYFISILKEKDNKKEEKKEDKKEEKKEDNKKKDKKQNKEEDIEDKEDKEKKTKSTDDDIVEIDNDLINKLLNNLKSKYYDNYDEWLNVGMAIKNLNLPFKLWDNFSRKSKKYQDGGCAKKWETFGNDYKLGLATLLYYLKDSDYTVYEEIETKLNSSYINFSCLTPEVYTRQLIYILNDNIIFCGNEKQKECYKWNNFYWEILDDDYIEIKKVIKNDLCKHFINLLDTKSLTSDYIRKNKIRKSAS